MFGCIFRRFRLYLLYLVFDAFHINRRLLEGKNKIFHGFVVRQTVWSIQLTSCSFTRQKNVSIQHNSFNQNQNNCVNPTLVVTILKNNCVNPTLAVTILKNNCVNPTLAVTILKNNCVTPTLAVTILKNNCVNPTLAVTIIKINRSIQHCCIKAGANSDHKHYFVRIPKSPDIVILTSARHRPDWIESRDRSKRPAHVTPTQRVTHRTTKVGPQQA
eukprot:sb/3470001/